MRSLLCALLLTSLPSHAPAAFAACAQQDAAKLIQPSPAPVALPMTSVATPTNKVATPASAVAPLTSDDVLAMLDAGLPTDTIVAKIKSSRATFDTSSDALHRLRDAGAPDAVIMAMLPPRNAAVAAPVGEAESVVEPKAPQSNVPASVRIPTGMRVELEMAHTIDSMTTRTNDPVSFRVVNPVIIDGVTVIAQGATATARVLKAERNGHWGRAGRIVWELREVTAVDGTRVPLQAAGRAVGDSKGAKVAAQTVLLGLGLGLAAPAALLTGFKRGENAVVP